MNTTKLRTIDQVRESLQGSASVEFCGTGNDDERYAHISQVLKQFDYPHRSKGDKGVLRAFLQHASGYSRAQITRLVKRWQGNRLADTPLAKRYRAPPSRFARTYTPEDIRLLVQMDKAHEDACRPAIAHLLRRDWTEYGDARYERLAGLSVSHLYNLRQREDYRAQRLQVVGTRPVKNRIGVRKAPAVDEPPDELAIRAEQNHACGAVDRAVLGSGLAHPGVADPEVVGGAALQCG